MNIDLSKSSSLSPRALRRFVATFLSILALAPALGAESAHEAPGASGAEAAASALVDRYVEALRRFDLEAMGALWTEDVVYADPTAGSRIEGRREAIDKLSPGFASIEDVELVVRKRLISNGYAVLVYDGSATMLEPEGESVLRVEVRAPGVIVLRIEGDRIAEHIDYIDYGAVRRQVAAARAAR